MGVSVWAAISRDHLIGPYIFSEVPDGEMGPALKPVTVNADRYFKMLSDYVIPQINALPHGYRLIFMQDGAPPHFSNVVRHFLTVSFPEWIGRGAPNGCIAWPPRSPDLTPCDFYLWGHIKELVYARKPTSYYELCSYIYDAFDQVSSAIRHKVIDGIPARYRNCIASNGEQQI